MDSQSLETCSLSNATKVVLAVAGFTTIVTTVYVVIGIMRIFKSVFKVNVTKKRTVATKQASKPVQSAQTTQVENEARGPDLKSLIKENQRAKKTSNPREDPAAHHELFLNTLKGHGDSVNDVVWSTDNKLVASACEDMYIRIFDVADITNKDPKHKRVKTGKIPIGVGFGDQTDSVVALLKGIPDAVVAKYAAVQKKPGENPVFDLQWEVKNVHGKEQGLAMKAVTASACVGRMGVVVTCSTKKEVKVLDLQGKTLATLEPASLANHDLAVSNDGRFVAVATFTADVKIWELRFSKEGIAFTGTAKVMDLKGHKSQIMCIAFSPDGKKVATASKDGTLRIWNIDVRYALEEDPKTLKVIAIPLPNGRCYDHLAFGPSSVLAASYEGNIHFINWNNGEVVANVIGAHDASITAMKWAPGLFKGGMAVLATASKDKRLRLWRSP